MSINNNKYDKKAWKKFDKEVIENIHGKIYYYRDLYEGKHAEIFPRAKHLIDKGEITDNIIKGTQYAQNVQTPYIIANVCKLIPEIPAMLVSRSIGKIESSLSKDDFQAEEITQETKEIIDLPEEDEDSDSLHVQQELIEQIQKNSNLKFEHWGNIMQQQLDGGLVGVPWQDEKGLRLEFKARDVYFPHEDGLGVDLAYSLKFDDEEYLHVYREEVKSSMQKDKITGKLVRVEDLEVSNLLYEVTQSKKTNLIDEETTKKILGLDELTKTYHGRGRPFIIYWPNEKTFMNPLGTSCLRGQDGKQDEVNWTLTRNALTFERNGKPRIAVSTEIMQALREKALERYGDEAMIDHRDLEITTLDENGKAMEIIQVDITKIGDIQWVKDLMKLMLMETKTSEKAVDFYSDTTSSQHAQSGIAKFYDLFTSLVKAEQIQDEYVYFLQQLIESALWLANLEDESVVIEEPEITLNSMIPISKSEISKENAENHEAGVQSIETTVRRMNPNASEIWVLEEVERIEASSQGDDTFSLLKGRQTATNYMDNKDEDGNPLDEEGNPIIENEEEVDEWTETDEERLIVLLYKEADENLTSDEKRELKELEEKKEKSKE